MTKSQNLQTTGFPKADSALERSIGPEHSRTGSDELMNTPHPRVLDEQLQTSLPVSVKQALSSTVDRDYNLTGYKLTTSIPQPDMDLAVSLLQKTLEPLPPDMILQELTKLKVKTNTRNMTTDEQTLMLTAYQEELSRFPGDIVRYVLRSMAATNPWFPAWADLAKELQWRTDKRQYQLDALIKGPDALPKDVSTLVTQALKGRKDGRQV